jgi:hypothetical protein
LGQRVITLHHADVAGSIVQMGPRSIAVKAANGQNWIVNLQPGTTKIAITGSAEPEMLTQGKCVRFVARIDKRTGKAQEKINSVTLFDQTPGVTERTLGVELASELPQGNAEEVNPAGLPVGPAAAPDEGIVIPDAGAPGPKTPKKRGPAAKGPDKSVPDVAAYDVCAEILSYHNGRLIVSVQNRFLKPKITVELAPDAHIGLDLEDLSLAQPGDKISASGFYITAGVFQQTDSVEVTLTNPLAPPGSRPHRPRPVAGGGTVPRPGTKAKTGADAAGKKSATVGKNAPPAEDLPAEKDKPPAKPQQEPETNPAPPIDVTPPVEPKPEPKKPDEKPAPKKPEKGHPDDDDTNVFDK